MVELFQNVFVLSLQIGLVIAIAVGIRRLGRKRYFAAGYYFFWMFLAVRLLFPMNMGWITLQEMNPLVGRNAVQGSVVDNEVQEYSKRFDNNIQQKMIQSQQEEGSFQTEEKELPLLQNSESRYKAVTDFAKSSKQGAAWKRWVSVIRDSGNQIWKWSTAIWLIGVVGYGFYQILIYQSICKKLKRWSRSVSKQEQQTFQKVKQEMGIKGKISVIQCSQVFSPMLIGLRNPTIILPEKGYDEQSLQFIYRHELTHFKHFDLYYKLLQTMVRSIYWFHPLVHLMYRKASFDMEIYCDEAVTKSGDKEYCQAYSLVLLNALIEKESMGKVPLTTYLNGGKEHMKERFKHIMNRENRKYGIAVLAVLIICAGILGNISLHNNIQAEQKEQVNQAQKSKDNAKNAKEITVTKNILLLGMESLPSWKSVSKSERTDMILLVTINPDSKQCYITEISRELGIPYKDGIEKIGRIYTKAGLESLKNMIKANLDITVDGVIRADFLQFENIIDAMGGLELSITQKEADYLNKTNYIREKKYRNITSGSQVLNGEQVLGYARIRNVETKNGNREVMGRGERASIILKALYEKCKTMSVKQWYGTIKSVYQMIETDLSTEDIYALVKAGLNQKYTLHTQQIPEDSNSFQTKSSETVGSYMEYDFTRSKSLKKLH